MDVHVSTMTGKLDGFRAINSNTRTNPFCLAMNQNAADNVICRSCYSHEMLKAYRANTVPALQRNSDALSKVWDPGDPVRLTGKGRKTFQPGEYVRISGHGEIVNAAYVANVMRIIRENPQARFSWWTKRHQLIRQYCDEHGKPDNLILVYSNPLVDAVIEKAPAWFDKTFNNVSKPTSGENCTGQKCRDCMACYDPKSSTNVIIERVK